jgi:hypothetical protein
MKSGFFLVFILFGNFAISQEVDLNPKSNQLVFLELFAGGSFLSITGFTFGGSANYQSKECQTSRREKRKSSTAKSFGDKNKSEKE